MRPWILFLLFACAAPAPVRVSDSPTGWIDDEPYPISKAWVYAADNANTKWKVVLASKRSFPPNFSGDLRSAHVELGGESHSIVGIGGSPEVVYFEFGTDPEGASVYAKLLGVEALGRVDPKLVLRSRLVPDSAQISDGTPRTARFVLENRGLAPFTFLAGGTGYGAEHDPRFQLSIERDGVVLLAAPGPVDLGGLRQPKTLEPGASHTFELDLHAWGSFDRPGSYWIRAQLLLEVEATSSQLAQPYDEEHLRWDATSAAECEFRIR